MMCKEKRNMTRTRNLLRTAAVVVAMAAIFVGCDDDDDFENAGMACESPADCYPDVDPATLSGNVECLERVEDGYCTHFCQVDADCCAVEGECVSGIPQVCAPLESTGTMQCFLSCENDIIGDMDASEYCEQYAHPVFGCRSSGGGPDNRRVCLP